MMDVLLARLTASQGTHTTGAPPAADSGQRNDEDVPFEVLEQQRTFGGWQRHKQTLHTGAHLPQKQRRADVKGQSDAPSKLRPVNVGASESTATGRHDALKRVNKNRPVEQSSKKPVPRLREVLQGSKKKQLDPRFTSVEAEPAEQHRSDLWRQRYAFVYDELLPQEQQDLKAQLTRTKNPVKKAELQQQLRQLNGKLQSEKDRRKQDERQDDVKAAQKEALKSGKTPYYPKRSEKRKLELLEKYKELKASGKLEKYIERKRKRNAAKDRKLVPAPRAVL